MIIIPFLGTNLNLRLGLINHFLYILYEQVSKQNQINPFRSLLPVAVLVNPRDRR